MIAQTNFSPSYRIDRFPFDNQMRKKHANILHHIQARDQHSYLYWYYSVYTIEVWDMQLDDRAKCDISVFH